MLSIEFEVRCSCGNGLCGRIKKVGTIIEVEPCEKCLEEARKDDYDEGYDNGFTDGNTKGYDEGYDEGSKETSL